MNRRISLYFYLLLISLAASGCSGSGAGLGSGSFRRVPVTDYFLVGSAPADFTGSSSSDPELVALASELVSSRAYLMGLYRQGDRFDTEIKQIRSGRADSVLLSPSVDGDTSRYLGEGSLVAGSETVSIELAIPTAGTRLENFISLELTGTFDRSAAQGLVDEVRTPAFEDNQSAGTTPGQFTLTGTRDSLPFSISFSQSLRGVADTYLATV